jgi:ADP-ribose pyrophosphatase YjhB (NUDIX family)
MQHRPSSRLLVLNGKQQILLFRFEHKNGPLSGQMFWATPGGGVDEGESYEDAARRELYEEVGLQLPSLGTQIAQRTAVFALPSGEQVEADERYFIVQVDEHAVSKTNWTQPEQEVIAEHYWWSKAELEATSEQVWPENLSGMLTDAGVWAAASDEQILLEQADYYRARAPEYEDWWRRVGRYDRGEEATARWRNDVAQVDDALARAELTGDVLELACGTGWWTERLARTARNLTCVDASPETVEINRARLRDAGVTLPHYEIANLFGWVACPIRVVRWIR